MMKRVSILLLLLQLVSCATYSQVSIWRQIFGQGDEIIFDASGKMISYPMNFVTQNTRFKFKVKSSAQIYEPWFNIMKKNLEESRKYLKSVEIETAYSCFFGDDYQKMLTVIDNLQNVRPTFCNADTLHAVLDTLNVYNLVPIKELIKNIENQYSVKVYLNNTCIETIRLSAMGNCSDGCIYFEASEYHKLKDPDCPSCLAEGPALIRFELIQENPWNKTIRDWFTTKAKSFNDANAGKTATLISELKQVADTGNTGINYKTDLNKMTVLKSWFINWLWFNGGKLALDPFNIYNDKGKQTVTDEIKSLDKLIRIARERLIFLDTARAKALRSGEAFQVIRTNTSDRITTEDELADLLKRKADEEASLASGKLVTSLRTNTVLYQGKLQRSTTWWFNNKSINPHKQFDALMEYDPIQQGTFARRKIIEIPEDQQLYIAVHNVPDTVRAIRFDEKKLPFNDLEEFTKILGEQFSQFETLSGSMSNLENLEEFVRALVVPGVGPKGAPNTQLTNVACNEIQPFLQGLIDLRAEGKQTFPPDADLFSKLTVSAPVNRTEIKAAKTEDAPFRDSIVIRALYKTDSADVAKTFVKVGKLRLFQLSAGIAITRKSAYITRIDTTGAGFKVSSSDNAATAIFGVKIYPFKNYNRDHGLLPRYPLRRLSVMGSFELLHPLDNFYLGGAYDIIPGLAISIGTNWYQKTNYQVENNTVTATSKKYEQSGAYYAVTVNPVLLAQFVKLFFKSL